ncbi:hypothetical protein [Novacetimonas pomaceti]|uniref:hypothetical protein n=1 Tax=Novacetimonas pomaceti TaxID=2021998 RepID=UPI001057704F|nr:hypothetical protein [Novacetimonas pomaceti]
MPPESTIRWPIAAHTPSHHATSQPVPAHHASHSTTGAETAPESLRQATMDSPPQTRLHARWRPPPAGGIRVITVPTAGTQRQGKQQA